MQEIINAMNKWANLQPQSPAVTGMEVSLTYRELHEAVCDLRGYLEQQRPRVLGILMDNSPAWVVVDLAAQAAGIPLLPIPGFFSVQQIEHAVLETGCDCILTDQPERFESFSTSTTLQFHPLSVLSGSKNKAWELRINLPAPPTLDQHIAKITYTSGTTGTPKGVCLYQHAINTVAQSLCKTVEMLNRDRHLCVLPLATLLENIAGVYVPLLAGAQCIVLPMQEIGLRGASEFDVNQLHRRLTETGATTMVLVPHLLQQLVEHHEQLQVVNTSLRFVAVGGAPVAPGLLERALEYGLPVYEGYGLSECASVVSVNHYPYRRPGSVGKPLPHTNIRFADDGEILLKGALFSGYLGQTPGQSSDYLATGDIGYLDDEGYLYITGRKKNMFITSYGRNVSPEWIERELVLKPAIQQAAVFGEGRPWNVAVIVPETSRTDSDINQAIEKVNENLPDYARIKTWLAASEPFSLINQQLTATGRLRRNEIWQKYAGLIEDLYVTHTDPHRKSA